jgi:hypothetical protein
VDRILVFNDEQFRASDPCNLDRFAMIGLAKLSECVLGSSTALNNLGCVADMPASMNVILQPGEIYMMENVDDTAYGPLPADTTHQILKQGILLDAVTFPVTAPVTPGDSVNYLIQVTYQDDDNTPENRPYFSGSPMPTDTIRSGLLVASLKVGIAAPTGTQVTPAPDAGYVGAWVITVANGQTYILSGDISQYPNAPFVTTRLPDALTITTADARYAQLAVTNTFSQYQKIPILHSEVKFTGTQSIPGGNADTRVDFNSIVSDTNGWWDATNFRWVPTIAGKYLLTCALYVNDPQFTTRISLYFNGSFYRRMDESFCTGGQDITLNASKIISFNGTTDYVDLRAAINDVTGSNVGANNSYFEIVYLGT